jgi:hypothetical protein
VNKKKQKNFFPLLSALGHGRRHPTGQRWEKLFCFFFSKKEDAGLRLA